MNPAFYTASTALGLDRLFEWRNRRRPVVLAFHGVTIDTEPHIYNRDGSHIDRGTFRRLVGWMSRRYRIVPLADIAHWLEGEAEVPERALAITFDDGYRDVLTHGVPVLREFGAPATVFVTTDFVMEGKSLWPDRLVCALGATNDKELAMDWDGSTIRFPLRDDPDRLAVNHRLREMLKALPDAEKNARVDEIVERLGTSEKRPWEVWDGFAPLAASDLKLLVDAGVEVGSHTCSHPIMVRCTSEQMADEAGRSKRLIEAATGVPCTSFGYPNGAAGDFDAETRRHLVAAGYGCAVTTLKERTSRGADPFEIPRMMLTHRGFTMSEFTVETSGFPAWLRRRTGRGAASRG
jgi:peptidoglycan/xylan/chitin deacetylase (PgdA/CDA1 family)